MEVRSARGARERESSPDRAKLTVMRSMQPKVKPIRKVQVVYYLCRNGQLEHPHYMEITHLADQQLRLRDFMDRLTVLRGKGMPALYSWSCKRGYKNGYVWNDLAENDVIYPSQGGEYVLKGSELLDKLQLSTTNPQIVQEHIVHPRGKLQHPTPQPTSVHLQHTNFEYHPFSPEEEQDEQEHQEVMELEDEEKISYASSTTASQLSRCSRGVSTDEIQCDGNLEPPVTSIKTSAVDCISKGSDSKRFEDGDPIDKPGRNSVLLHLISCGNMAVNKAKTVPPNVNRAYPNHVNYGVSVRKSNVCESDMNLRKGALYKAAVSSNTAYKRNDYKVAGGGDHSHRDEEEKDIIRYMPENPRHGKLQCEDKEYFSGSLVDSMNSENRSVVPEPSRLKRSNSYGDDRSSKPGLLEEEADANEDDDIKDKAALKGKCLPRKISSLTSKPMRR